LTIVLPRRPDCGVSPLISAGLDTIALRSPIHRVGRDLMMRTGRPIAAPSANRSGRVSPTTAGDVAAELGDRVELILDDGPCAVGIEPTVLDLTGPSPVLLRFGGVTLEDLASVLGPIAVASAGEATRRSPGRLASHYAPSLPVRLDARDVRP